MTTDPLIKRPVKLPVGSLFAKLFLFFYCLSPLSISARPVHEILKQIPAQDLAYIRLFFEYVIYQTPSPFTLFGDKPMSGIGCLKCMNPYYFAASSYKNSLPKYYAVWKKYAHLFPSKNYLFSEHYNHETKNLYITLFNKEACVSVISTHLTLFQEILLEKSDSQVILSRILSSSDTFSALNEHQGLYGLLFGFGKTNAFRFHNIYEDNLPYKPLTLFNKDEYHPIKLFRIPDFVAVSDDPETVFLEQKYRAQREAITQAYFNKNFLEVTLAQFMEK